MEKRGKENATKDQFETRRCDRVGKITTRCIGGKEAGDAAVSDSECAGAGGVGRFAGGRKRSLGNYLQNSRIVAGRLAKMQTPWLIPRLI